MRPENRHRVGLVLALAANIVVACGGGPAPSPSPVPSPSPSPTPVPHLTDPVSINVVFTKLNGAGLSVKANTANQSQGGEPLRRINATYRGWPLIISEFSSTAALRSKAGFTAGARPKTDEPPYTFAGLNVLVEFGNRSTGRPASPDPRLHTAALELAQVLDPLLGPIEQRSIEPLPLLSGASAAASPAP